MSEVEYTAEDMEERRQLYPPPVRAGYAPLNTGLGEAQITPWVAAKDMPPSPTPGAATEYTVKLSLRQSLGQAPFLEFELEFEALDRALRFGIKGGPITDQWVAAMLSLELFALENGPNTYYLIENWDQAVVRAFLLRSHTSRQINRQVTGTDA